MYLMHGWTMDRAEHMFVVKYLVSNNIKASKEQVKAAMFEYLLVVLLAY